MLIECNSGFGGAAGTPPSATVAEIQQRLRPLYRNAAQRRGLNALDELIFTVLTQNTSDLNAERAYATLRERYPTWAAVLDAPPTAIRDAIRHGGLANIKSVRIQTILRQIQARHGALDLDWLKGSDLQTARAWLMDLDGVGIKSASVVAAFALHLPAMPVDTHIYRVSKRLGLIDTKTNVERAHYALEAQTKPTERFEFHMLLITHGRHICKAQKPRCAQCPLSHICPSAFRQ